MTSVRISSTSFLGATIYSVVVNDKTKYDYSVDTAHKEKIDRFKSPLKAFNFIKKRGNQIGKVVL